MQAQRTAEPFLIVCAPRRGDGVTACRWGHARLDAPTPTRAMRHAPCWRQGPRCHADGCHAAPAAPASFLSIYVMREKALDVVKSSCSRHFSI